VVAGDGAPLRLVTELAGALSLTPDAVHMVGLVDASGRPAVFSFLMRASARRELGGQKILGVTLKSAMGDAATVEREVSVAEAARRAVVSTGETIREVAAALRQHGSRAALMMTGASLREGALETAARFDATNPAIAEARERLERERDDRGDDQDDGGFTGLG
jgi:hypothetical protein